MSWLEKGFSSLKGQISNFTKEVLSEDTPGSEEETHGAAASSPSESAGDVSNDGAESGGPAEGFFGQALGLAQISLFGRGEGETAPGPGAPAQREEALQQASLSVEAAVKSDLRPFPELPPGPGESPGPGSGSGSGSGRGSNTGSGDSPQLSGLEDVGVSPALSEDGFTKLDPSETELWEATQELSQSLEVQLEFHKKELESFHQMKQEWLGEKANLESTVHTLQKQLQALQDWQTPDQDFLNGNETELKSTTSSLLQQEIEELRREKIENSKMVESLKSQLLKAENENSELSAGMEELDSQHQDALERVLQMKRVIQEKYDVLHKEHETLSTDLKRERENFIQCQKEKLELEQTMTVIEENSQSLERLCESLKSKVSALESQNEALQKELSLIQLDQSAKLLEENEFLKQKLATVQSEKSELMSKLDSVHFDFDSLEVKLGTVLSENETLKKNLLAVQTDLQSARLEMEDKISESANKTSDSNSNEQTSIEKYIIEKLKTIISVEIPMEYCKDIARRDGTPERELEDQLDMVAALVKMIVDLKWKKETLERNLVDFNRQSRELSAQVSARDKKIAKLEEECVLLRENMESLLDGLNVTPEKGMLPSIPETPEAGDEDNLEMGPIQEEDEECEEEKCAGEEDSNVPPPTEEAQHSSGRELNATIRRLERELEVLREARSNLEHESQRLRNELHDLAARLRSSESMLRNQDNLEREVERSREKFERLASAYRDLQNKNSSLEEEAELARFGQDSLQAEVSEWKTVADTAIQERQDAVNAKETLVADLTELKANLKAVSSLNEELQNTVHAQKLLEEEVHTLRETCATLSASNKNFEGANVIINEARNEISDLRNQLSHSESRKDELETRIKELSDNIESLNHEKQSLNDSIVETKELLQNVSAEKAALLQQVSSWQEKYEKISSDLTNQTNYESSKTGEVLKEKESLEALVVDLQENCRELSNAKSSFETEISKLNSQLDEKHRRCQHLEAALLEKENAFSEERRVLELDVQSLQQKVKELQLRPITSEESRADDVSSVEALERRLHSMLEEKEQMLSVLTEKSRENGVLRSENQKLLSAISSKQEEAQISAQSDQTNLLLQQVKQLQQEKEQLIATVQVKHNESVQYHSEILRLSALLNQQQNVVQSSMEQSASNAMANSSQPKEEKNYEVQALEEKCAALASSLQQERVQNSYLQNEMQEQHEKEGMLIKELERLRVHLMEVGETHTAETLRLEEQVQDLQGKLDAAEERLRSISTVHTSASIRANQHVESLQGQSRLISQQRDELQAKLSAAEDREQKNAAALRNLQAVLEQFQRDKERDLASMTEKLRLELQGAHEKQSELSEEIRVLQNKLAEAKEGLSAAARLGEQLDKKSEIISHLKEQINQLQGQLKAAEGRVQGVEGKVDRSLVKNLVVGLLTAPPNTRSPALRAVASVLDFSREERQRVGIEQGSNQHSEQSLSEAFVRFLESESRPQMQFRLLPEQSSNTTSRAGNRKESLESNSSTSDSPVRRSPLLSEVVLPTLAPLPVGRSSSSILKDVLKRNDV